MMHYLPQDHISIYEPFMQQNYSVAIKYYQQKRVMFEQQFKKQFNVNFEEVRQAFNTTLEKEWMKKIELLTTSLQSHPINEGRGGYYYTTTNSYTPGSDSEVDQIISIVARRGAYGKASNPKALLGQLFEPFVNNKIFNNKNLDASITNAINSSASNIITEITGAKTSKSALSNGPAQIGPDIMMTFDPSFNWNKNNGKLSGGINKPIDIELQSFIDLQITDDNELISLLYDYLESGMSGLNLKYFPSASGKKFTSSTVLQNRLNAVFRQRHDGSYHSWEEEYATAYANWEVSRHLINLINPNVIAIVTGSEFQWVDAFLQSHILRMRVQRASTTDKHKKLPFNSKRNGKSSTETLPLIRSPEVYIQTMRGLRRMQKIERNRSGGRVVVKNILSSTKS